MKTIRSIRVALLASALTLPTLAWAQATEAPADDGVGEIIVTAQKRSENVQNVPIAITALSGQQIASAGVTDTQSLRAAVPALNVTTAVGGFGLPRIRGIGSTGQGAGIENPVAVYVDGVYYSAAFGVLQSLYDVDQVAVLKGPQGTLFGRNATGGLIQITTKGPDFDWNGKAQIGYTTYQTMEMGAYVSGPLSENIAFSLSGQYLNRDRGYGRNVFTGRDVKDDQSWSGRAKLLWRAGDSTDITLAFDYNGRNAAEPAFANFGLNTLGQNVPTEITNRGGDPRYDIFADIDPVLRARQWGASATIDHDFGSVKLKSITAYRRSELYTLFDPDGTTTPTLAIANNYLDREFTQEVNLVSDRSGPFNWVVGGFYMWNEGANQPRPVSSRNQFAGNYTDSIATSGLNSLSGFVEGSYKLSDATRITAGIRYTSDRRKLNAFNQTYCAVVAAPTCTAALIGTYVNGAVTDTAQTFDKATWKVALDHRFSDQFLMYASYNRGFRSGTYIPQATPILTLKPEVVDAFEVGFKSDLFDRKVRFNLAGYYYDQTNVQVVQIIAGVQNVYNATGARIYGLDGDLTLKLTDNLKLFGGFNWTHARYKSFTDAIVSVPFPLAATTPTFSTTQFSYVDSATGTTIANTVCLGTFLPATVTTQAARDGFYRARLGGNCLLRGDASGKKLQNTPDLTFSLGGSLDVPTEVGKFTLAGNVYYNAGFVATPDERVQQPSYVTVDASVAWKLPDEHLTIRFFGRNLTNAFYRTQLSASNSGDNGTTAAPRTYGFSVGFDF